MSETLTLFFWADDAHDAIAQARAWAKAEPRLRLATEPGNARRATGPDGAPSAGFNVDVTVRVVDPKVPA